VSKVVLGQTGTTDTGSRVGTADAHEKVRDDIEQADAVQLGATLTRDIAIPVVALNMGPRARYPRVKLNRPDQEDVGKLVDNVRKLVPFGLRVERSWMADKLGIPDPDKEAEILIAPKKIEEPKADGEKKQNPDGDLEAEEEESAQAEELQTTGRDSVERLATQLELTAASAMDGMIDRVKELVNDPSITSMEQLSARLLEAYPGMRISDVAEIFASALLTSNLSGRDEVDDVEA
jgi:phage gp29-like protein